MPKFKLDIVKRPAIRVAGFKVRTSFEDASVNCAKLWEEKIMPIQAFPWVDPAHRGESFGVSVGVDPRIFDYYAAMALKKGEPVPAGMEAVDLAETTYCVCRLEEIKDISPAFMHIYSEWPKEQDKYEPVFDLPCYEFYGKEYPEKPDVEIYCPVREK